MTEYNEELFAEFHEDKNSPDDYINWLESEILEYRERRRPLLSMWFDFMAQNKRSHTWTGEFLEFLDYDYKGDILQDIRYLLTGKRK